MRAVRPMSRVSITAWTVARLGCLVSVLAVACSPAAREPAPRSAGAALDSAGRPIPGPSSAAMRTLAPERFAVHLQTTAGDIVLEVERSWAPVGADRFYNLVRHGFYDDQRIFRVRAGYIAQFGLSGDPAVTAAWKHATMPDDALRQSNRRGTVAYAMTGPGTRTTQVFINLAENVHLDAEGFAPFARVVRGMDVVDRLYAGYGETAGGGMRGGRQGPIESGGNGYLRREFPRLDVIVRATMSPRS